MNKIKFYLILGVINFLMIGCTGDDEPQLILPAISINDATGAEGNKLTFEIYLSKRSEEVITVEVNTSDASAIGGKDYISKSSTITFNPGDSLKIVAISILTDSEMEENETFSVQLGNAIKATIGDGVATGIIADTPAIFMEARIDGLLWQAQLGGFFGAEIVVSGPTFTTLSGIGKDGDSQITIISPTNGFEERSYEFKTRFDDALYGYYVPHLFSSGGQGIGFFSTGGELKITKFDRVNAIVEGTFELTSEARDKDSKVIGSRDITEGRFALPLKLIGID
jgi:hypothetical protein